MKEEETINAEQTEYLIQLIKELEDIYTKEEIMWRHRSGIRWLKEGDRNTAFFHKIANSRKRQNTIDNLL